MADFNEPPVVEMAIGAQFRPVPELRGINLGALRSEWRNLYPVVEEHPPLAPAIESPATPGLEIQFAVRPGLPANRYWFTSADGTHLVQIQSDRLIVNWRGVAPGETSRYPRYPTMRETFNARLTELAAFADQEGLAPPRITQVEVNYINALPVAHEDQGRLEHVLRSWSGLRDHHLGDPAEGRASMIFEVPGLGTPPVRLFVNVDPAVAPDGSSAWFMTLMVRGAPSGEDVADALEFADGAHEHLVASFMELTTESMHAKWGLRA